MKLVRLSALALGAVFGFWILGILEGEPVVIDEVRGQEIVLRYPGGVVDTVPRPLDFEFQTLSSLAMIEN